MHCQPPRQSHFRHCDADDCGASYESAVHLLAKNILEREKRIMLPYLDVFTSMGIAKVNTFAVKERLVDRQLFRFDRAALEVWMDGRIPDVVLWKRDEAANDHRLLVEIVVTHDISKEKLQWIREGNLATIKVYLSWADRAITEDELKRCLIKGRAAWGGNIVHWVHHPKLEEMQRTVDEYYLESLRDGTNGPNMSLENRGRQRVPSRSEARNPSSAQLTRHDGDNLDPQRRLF